MGFAFSPDGKAVATLDSRFTAPERVWDSPRRIAADDLGGVLQVRDTATGSACGRSKRHSR